MVEEGNSSIAGSAIVCVEARLTGEVTIGEGCIVHPSVVFDAKNGPIIVGENNIFEEFCIIRNNSDGQPMIIGDGNIFQVGSECFAKYIGSRNSVGVRAVLEDECFIADDCNIGAKCRVYSKQTLESFVNVYGSHNQQAKTSAVNLPTISQLDLLRRLLPSYHHLYGKKPQVPQKS